MRTQTVSNKYLSRHARNSHWAPLRTPVVGVRANGLDLDSIHVKRLDTKFRDELTASALHETSEALVDPETALLAAEDAGQQIMPRRLAATATKPRLKRSRPRTIVVAAAETAADVAAPSELPTTDTQTSVPDSSEPELKLEAPSPVPVLAEVAPAHVPGKLRGVPVPTCAHCGKKFCPQPQEPNATLCRRLEDCMVPREAAKAKAEHDRRTAAEDARKQREAAQKVERVIRQAVLSGSALPEGAVEKSNNGRQVVVLFGGQSYTVCRPKPRQQGRQHSYR